MKKKAFVIIFLFVLSVSAFGQTVADVDGNSYNTVSIGNHRFPSFWMTHSGQHSYKRHIVTTRGILPMRVLMAIYIIGM